MLDQPISLDDLIDWHYRRSLLGDARSAHLTARLLDLKARTLGLDPKGTRP